MSATLLADDGPERPNSFGSSLRNTVHFGVTRQDRSSLRRRSFRRLSRTFRATQNKRIPIDFEHASGETHADAIPTEGAPALSWIIDLDDRGMAGLWGLVGWLEPLRTYHQTGPVQVLQPAIGFGSEGSRIRPSPLAHG